MSDATDNKVHISFQEALRYIRLGITNGCYAGAVALIDDLIPQVDAFDEKVKKAEALLDGRIEGAGVRLRDELGPDEPKRKLD